MLIIGMSMASISASPLPKLFVDPPTYHAAQLGEIFTINITIFNVTSLGVFEFYLGYDTTLLDALDAVVGPFPPDPYPVVDINDPQGYIWISVECAPTQGNGTLAIITFNATYAGSASCTLDLYDTVIGDWKGDYVPHDVEDGYYEFVTRAITVATDKPLYLPGENVEIHGNLTLPYEGLVSIAVNNPDNYGLVMRTLQMGTAPPGDINITELYPSDGYGYPKYNFRRGMDHAYFTVAARNSGTEWKTVVLTVNAYDGNMVPLLPVQSFKVSIAPGWATGFIAGIWVSEWAYIGTGMVYASALTDYPKYDGAPYCPEKSATFGIIAGAGGGAGAPETQGSGTNSTPQNYSLTFKLPPNAKTGIYRVYANFFCPGHFARSNTAFGIHIICVPIHYPTIQGAINAATTTNNSILVQRGTYNENLNINKPLTLIGADSSNTIINGSGTGNVVTITANNVEVTSFTIQNSGSSGILLQGSSGNTIQDNIITSNDYGINVQSSNNNFILENKLSNNNYGIYLNHSTTNTLTKNKIAYNKYNFGVSGDSLSDFTHNIDTSNTVGKNTLYYWINKTDDEIPADAGFVAIINSERITVKALDLTKNVQGVLFAFTNDSLIERVNTRSNEYGIYLFKSFGNTIAGGTTSNNVVGIYMKNSNTNKICHKNFIDNTNQVELYQSPTNTWNDGAGKGNHWSDYTGEDQNGDGVGDTLLPHQGVDMYPLINPWTSMHDIAITTVTHLLPRSDVDHAYPGWKITITATIKNEGDFTETNFPITAYYDGNPVKTKTVSELNPIKEAAITFTWDTTGISNGTYTIKATVGAVPGETVPNQADNTLIDGTVKINRMGDVNSDDKVNILDVKLVKLAYSGIIQLPSADVNGDGVINILDVKLVKLAYSGII